MAKKRSDKWFYKKRGSYLPCSWQAWLIYALTLVYILAPLLGDLLKAESMVYIVTSFITRLLIAGVVMTLIAQKKS